MPFPRSDRPGDASRPTVLVTGAAGLLGTWLRRTVPDGVELVATRRRRAVAVPRSVGVDLRDPAATRAAVDQVRPDVILHAAYALDESSIVGATGNVTAAARAVGADVVAVSTDAVFAGDGTPRSEAAAPDPVTDYGRWKYRAEQIVGGLGDGATIVRLPLVVSLDPADPVVTRVRSGAATGDPTVWFDDEIRQPAMAADLAAALWRIVCLTRADRRGVWHLPGPERLSRFRIAQRVVTALGLSDDAIRSEPTPSTTVRPRDLCLSGDRARSGIDWAPATILG